MKKNLLALVFSLGALFFTVSKSLGSFEIITKDQNEEKKIQPNKAQSAIIEDEEFYDIKKLCESINSQMEFLPLQKNEVLFIVDEGASKYANPAEIRGYKASSNLVFHQYIKITESRTLPKFTFEKKEKKVSLLENGKEEKFDIKFFKNNHGKDIDHEKNENQLDYEEIFLTNTSPVANKFLSSIIFQEKPIKFIVIIGDGLTKDKINAYKKDAEKYQGIFPDLRGVIVYNHNINLKENKNRPLLKEINEKYATQDKKKENKDNSKDNSFQSSSEEGNSLKKLGGDFGLNQGIQNIPEKNNPGSQTEANQQINQQSAGGGSPSSLNSSKKTRKKTKGTKRRNKKLNTKRRNKKLNKKIKNKNKKKGKKKGNKKN